MKVFIKILFITLALCLSQNVKASTDILDQLKGSWMEINYHNFLRAQKNDDIHKYPYNPWWSKDSKNAEITSWWLNVNEKKDGYYFLQMISTDGWGFRVKDLKKLTDNKYEIILVEKRKGYSDIKLTVLNSNKIILSWEYKSFRAKKKTTTKSTYIKVGKLGTDIYNYINSISLKGTYKDKKGKTYIFKEDCKAIWDETPFKYHLGFIHFGCPSINSRGKQVFSVLPDSAIKNNTYREKPGYKCMWKNGKLRIMKLIPNKKDKYKKPKEKLYTILEPIKQ